MTAEDRLTKRHDLLSAILLTALHHDSIGPELSVAVDVLAHIPGTEGPEARGWHWVYMTRSGQMVYFWARSEAYGWNSTWDDVELVVYAADTADTVRNVLRLVVTSDDPKLPAPARTLLEDQCLSVR